MHFQFTRRMRTFAENSARLGPLGACAGWTEARSSLPSTGTLPRSRGKASRTGTSDHGTQRYHLVLPKGVEATLGHVERAPVRMTPNKK
jgi:hypothetical protein